MKNNKNKIGIITIALILFLIQSGMNVNAASVLPDSNYDFYVYDEAHLLDNTTKKYIIQVNKELFNKTGAQVVVAIVNSLDSMDINRYATALFEKWEIGSREYDNGILLLIASEEQEIWIEVGYGLEGALPDSRVKRIIDTSIVPKFANDDYNTGVILGFNSILDYVEAEYNIILETRSHMDQGYVDYEESYTGISPGIPLIAIIIFLFIDFKFFRGWLTFSLLRGLGRGGPRGGGGFSGGSRGGGGRSGGGGAGGKW